MTNIERKALELVNEIHIERNDYAFNGPFDRKKYCYDEALCRAIEQHEAFRQEVSDALLEFYGGYFNSLGEPLNRFIIRPKLDPLVKAFADLGWYNAPTDADDLRAALAKRGGRIVFDD